MTALLPDQAAFDGEGDQGADSTHDSEEDYADGAGAR